MDLGTIQTALREEHLDGWLLYDFRGSNPISARVAGVGNSDVMATRRWFYLLPVDGEPRGLVHAIERHNLDHLPGEKHVYANRLELEAGLRAVVAGRSRLAMEYSPGGTNPYVSRVDAGTLEQVRSLGVQVVSSGDLAQRFEAAWSPEALVAHREASDRLYRIKDRAFAEIARKLNERGTTTELEIQGLMLQWFEEDGLVTDSGPLVAAQENAGNPHYVPTASAHRQIGRDEIVLLDLWGKRPGHGSVYADITWVGFTGTPVPTRYAEAFATIREARDAAIALIQEAARNDRDLRGWQVDRAARAIVERAGYGPRFVHRTGHSLGTAVHGNGVHMDDFETHDDRRLSSGAGFTIEPGVYFDSFGLRTEINMYYGEHEAFVTGPTQTEIVALTN